MSITYVPKPGLLVSFPITGDFDLPLIPIESINEVSFQLQWSAGLATGIISLMGSNQALPVYGEASDVTYPPPLTPMTLATPIDVSMAPYSTNLAGFFDVQTACAWVWIRYIGAGGGNLSIAYHGKSFG